jgi:Glycosyl hydrolases family 39
MSATPFFLVVVGAWLSLSFAWTSEVSKLVPSQEPIPRTFFGMHIHHLVSANAGTPMTPWPNVPIPEWRLWDARVTWRDLEPHRGIWKFDNLDKSLAFAREHDAEVMLTLGATPYWASARPQEPPGYQPGSAAEPLDTEDWRTFVKTVVARYKGQIHYYEIWNEPNLKQFWSGSPDQLVMLTREASQIIHGIDPKAIVVSPPFTSDYGIKSLAEFLSKGGGQYVDVIGYHFYVSDKPPEAVVSVIEQVRQTMKANGVGDKPLWDTEMGWFKPKPFPSDQLGAAYLARAFILNWAAGVQRIYWYSWDNQVMTVQATENDAATLKPAGRAFEVIQRWLLDARMNSCVQDQSNTWTCRLDRKGTQEWIVWNPDGDRTITPPSSWHPKTVAPLLQEAHPWSGTTLDIGQAPILVSN